MVDDKILQAVKIENIEHSTHPDAETEYWLNFWIVASIGPTRFHLGEGNQDRYVCGARKYDDEDELLADITTIDHITYDNLNNATAQQIAQTLANAQGKPEKAQLYMNRLFSNKQRMDLFFKALIIRKVAREHRHEIKKFMHEANAMAAQVQKEWEKLSDDM